MNTVVYIGRFQPFHFGHLYTLRSAACLADRVVVVLGSAGAPPSTRNPWDVVTRMQLIKNSLPKEVAERTRFTCVGDCPGDNATWAANVRSLVSSHATQGRVFLAGVAKDPATLEYLRLFESPANPVRDWQLLAAAPQPQFMCNGSDIRRSYFMDEGYSKWEPLLPEPVAEFLKSFRVTNNFVELAMRMREESKGKNP